VIYKNKLMYENLFKPRRVKDRIKKREEEVKSTLEKLNSKYPIGSKITLKLNNYLNFPAIISSKFGLGGEDLKYILVEGKVIREDGFLEFTIVYNDNDFTNGSFYNSKSQIRWIPNATKRFNEFD